MWSYAEGLPGLGHGFMIWMIGESIYYFQLNIEHSPRFTMWPQLIVNTFEKVDPEADKHSFYGPWNSVLFHCFLLSEGYIICPQFPVSHIEPSITDTADFVITFSIMKNEATIFFVEVKAPKYLKDIYARGAADDSEQMRKRFDQLFESLPYKMHGISAFGTNVCFYQLEKDNATGIMRFLRPPPAAKYSEQFLVDVAPKNWWNLNILDQEGYDKFMEFVEEAKALKLHERMHLPMHVSQLELFKSLIAEKGEALGPIGKPEKDLEDS
ncbi:uncharacterized protein LACBIDRAFT_335537 [Laccaria bicolor S238N-H82]|uniref:Predicted protein n=1 Tax=Laccaria bicolor (strain S238N-H82 / ATCC MYA-4686) TaxID=486041 RepID=B0E2L2_LACBS|nr:uncharacterized protein LACBIDRAFT_335537 [Laccaria bicolor S238N-H82]EDQ98923.1 predicted protein [Laccaria bicolor S238N-H82]|eukprot:XP_001890434.1 predicted protein [Laccaria bicolor S238N-H82]